MSFLKIGDRAAGAIKSGGTTRRAAKMVVVDVDHPDIEEFIDWKVVEEQKVAALVAGSRLRNRHLNAIMRGLRRRRRRRRGPRSTRAATRRCARPSSPPGGLSCPRTTSSGSSSSRARAITHIEFPDYDTDWDSRPTHRLRPELQQLGARHRRVPARRRDDGDWALTGAPTGKVAKTVEARASCGTRSPEAAWACADPGMQYDTTINDWHTCPAIGPDQRVEPVLRVHVPRRHGLQSGVAEPDALPPSRRHVRRRRLSSTPSRLWTVVLEISVLMAQFPRAGSPSSPTLPHAGPGLRQSRRAADGVRASPTTAPKAAPSAAR